MVPGHLVAQTDDGPIAARRAVLWDPLLETFSIGDGWEFDRLFRRLDPLSAFADNVSRGLVDTAGSVGGFMGEMFAPRFFIIGGVGAILLAYAIYYWLWSFIAKFLILYVALPGMAFVFSATVFCRWRQGRLHTAMFQAAWHAYDPAAYHSPG